MELNSTRDFQVKAGIAALQKGHVKIGMDGSLLDKEQRKIADAIKRTPAQQQYLGRVSKRTRRSVRSTVMDNQKYPANDEEDERRFANSDDDYDPENDYKPTVRSRRIKRARTAVVKHDDEDEDVDVLSSSTPTTSRRRSKRQSTVGMGAQSSFGK